jgi:uncharacterized membrane protein YhaH (DUF805 family)
MSGTPDPDAERRASTVVDRPGGATTRRGATTPPRQRTPAKPKPPAAPVLVAAAVTTGWASLVSLTPVLLAVAAVLLISPSPTDAEAVVRGGVAAWFLAHGVPIGTGVGPVSLTPLAVTALAVWRIVRAGVHTARVAGARRSRSLAPALRAGAAVGLAYGVYGSAAAAAISTSGLRVEYLRAGVTLAGFGLVAGLGGALREGGWPARVAARVPEPIRDGLRTGSVAVLLVLAAGAAATGLALALSAGVAVDMIRQYHTGVVGQAGLTLVCLVYAPNLAVWGAGYLVGPGFAIGVGTKISTATVTLGPVPAAPVLAAVPGRPLPAWSGLILTVPLLAGMIAGWLLARRRLRAVDRGWWALLAPAAFAGPVAGAALALAAVASGGSLGDGRLAQVGAGPWPLAVVTTAVVAVGALATAAAMKVLLVGRRNVHVSTRSAAP